MGRHPARLPACCCAAARAGTLLTLTVRSAMSFSCAPQCGHSVRVCRRSCKICSLKAMNGSTAHNWINSPLSLRVAKATHAPNHHWKRALSPVRCAQDEAARPVVAFFRVRLPPAVNCSCVRVRMQRRCGHVHSLRTATTACVILHRVPPSAAAAAAATIAMSNTARASAVMPPGPSATR